jgi:hypothetical protein
VRGSARSKPPADADERALEREAVVVLGGRPDRVQPFVHSVRATTTAAVERVVAGRCSAVLKIVRPRWADPSADASLEPASFRWWRREAEILGSPALDPYRGAGLRPPILLATFERADGALALWLEDAGDQQAPPWTVAAIADAARRLGMAQGTVAAAGGPAATTPLSREFLASYLADLAPRVPYGLLDDPAAWRRPLVAEHLPPGLREPLSRLHAEQAAFVRWVSAAPTTLAHHDLWPNNLFVREHEQVLIDWAFAGVGSLGQDPGNLVLDSVWDLLMPAAVLPELDAAVLAGYLDGLRAAGWAGDERNVRLAMCASAVKYDWLGPVMLAGAAEERQVGYGGEAIEDAAHLYGERGRAFEFLVGWAEEARGLAAELGLR